MPEKPFNELNKRQRKSKLINFSFKTNNKSHKHQFTEELWHRMYFTKKLKIKLGLHLLFQACEPHYIEHYFVNKHLPLNTSLASNEFLILIRLISLGEVFQIQAFVFAILIEASIFFGFCHTHITWEWSCSSFLMGKHCALGTPGKVCVLSKQCEICQIVVLYSIPSYSSVCPSESIWSNLSEKLKLVWWSQPADLRRRLKKNMTSPLW